MKVKEILGKKPTKMITITPDQSLLTASQLLTEHNIGAVVVVDEDNNPVGILSERDIIRKLASLEGDVVSHHVQDTMTKDIIIGLLNDDLSYVTNTMTNKRIRHLPIMEDGKLVGMVSIGDVVKSQMESFANEAHTLRQYISGGYQ